MIYLSNGSDLSLKSCFELFTMPRDKVIILQPTFGMVNVYCDLYNLKKIEIKYNKKLELNYDKLLKSISKKNIFNNYCESKQPNRYNNRDKANEKNFK